MYGKQTIGLAIVALLAAGATMGTAMADQPDQSLAAGASDTRQLIQLMNKDQNGAVSKQAFLNFMAAEYDSLGPNRADKLEVSALTQPHANRSSVPHK
jgi:hypothetical protein